MAQGIINDGESGLSVRTDLNANFTELYGKKANAFITVVPDPGAYTLLPSDLVLINLGASLTIEGDNTGNITLPLNATVAIPVGTMIGARKYGSFVATGGVTATGSSGSLIIPNNTTALAEKTGTDIWLIHNGQAAALLLALANTAGLTIMLDLVGQPERKFAASVPFGSFRQIIMVNTENALAFHFFFEISHDAASIQVPTDWRMVSDDYDGTTWTPPDVGNYEFAGLWTGAHWFVKVAGPFT